MNEELTLATEELRQYASDREWFIPVLLSECDVPARSIGAGETLLDINWVALHEDWDAGIKRILSVIKPIPVSVQNLISALRSEDEFIRVRSFFALGKTGGLAVMPVLFEALKNEDKEVRFSAALALGQIGPAAVPALIEALKDEDKNIRSSVALAMGMISPKAKAAVPALIEALKDEDKEVRFSAALALESIRSEAKAAVPALIETLKDEDKEVREQTAGALEEINTPEARKAVEEYNKKSK
jgi:HEAT repeat protein